MKFILIFILFLSTFIAPLYAAEQITITPLNSLVSTALTNNPELKASSARWQMFSNKIKQAGALDDPMLMFKIQNALIRDPFNFKRDPMTQKVIGISQMVPFWGKRELREDIARLDAENYRWALDERKLELARMVKETYYQIYATDKGLELIEKNIRIMSDFITLAETRYAVGQGAQQDIFKAQVEQSRMLDMQISLQQQRKSLEAALNALLYRQIDTQVPKIDSIEIMPVSQSPEMLQKLAEENRPYIKSLQTMIDKAKSEHQLAEKEFYPDVTISFEYMQRDRIAQDPGYDMYAAGFTFNLPVQRERRHSMLAESSSSLNMGTYELDAFKNSLQQGISDLMSQLDARRRLIELYTTGTIPQAEKNLESAIIGYRVGKIDFMALLDSRITLFNLERDYHSTLAEYQMKRAQLDALIGQNIQ